MLKMTGIELECVSDHEMHLFIKKEWEEVFLTLLKDIIKKIINTWQIMTVVQKVYTLLIKMQVIYMTGQWFNIFPMVDLNG